MGEALYSTMVGSSNRKAVGWLAPADTGRDRPPGQRHQQRGQDLKRGHAVRAAARRPLPRGDEPLVLLAHLGLARRGPGAVAQHRVARRVPLSTNASRRREPRAVAATYAGVGQGVWNRSRRIPGGEHLVRRRGGLPRSWAAMPRRQRVPPARTAPSTNGTASASSVAASRRAAPARPPARRRAERRRCCRRRTPRHCRARPRPPSWSRSTRCLTSTLIRPPQVDDLAEELVGGEGEVGVAQPRSDDPQRLCWRWSPQALLDGVGDGGVEEAQELLDLAVLRPPAGVGRCPSEIPSAIRRVVLGVAAACRGRGRGRPRPCGSVWTIASRFLVTRSCRTRSVLSTRQLPRCSSSRASTAAAASSPTAWRRCGPGRRRRPWPGGGGRP